MQFESPISYGSKVTMKVKVFKMYVKGHGLGHTVKKFGTDGKVLSQGVHMCNMKAISLTVQKLGSRLKFSKCRSTVMVTR